MVQITLGRSDGASVAEMILKHSKLRGLAGNFDD